MTDSKPTRDDTLSAHKLQDSTPILARPERKYQEEGTYTKSFLRNVRNDVTCHAFSAHVSVETAFRLCNGLRVGTGNSRHTESVGYLAKDCSWAFHHFAGNAVSQGGEL